MLSKLLITTTLCLVYAVAVHGVDLAHYLNR
jgi:hypothetical protein